MNKRALITGVAGQDGSYLAELLIDRGYEVFGVVRRPTSEKYENLSRVRDRVELIQADVVDQLSLIDVLEQSSPLEVYNLAAPSFVPTSWRQPILTAELAAVGVTALLEAIRHVDPSIRFYQASSSEIFGEPLEAPQNEDTPVAPVSPYGVAKAYAHFITRSYRRAHALHASSGVLFNHESPRRPPHFLPSKVARGAALIAAGVETELLLGDLEARRDWGFAGDYVEAMWLMLQQDEPDDYVIATGESHSVGELVEVAFSHVGLDWHEYVRTDPEFVRGRAELRNLVGDAAKARDRFGWERTIGFEDLIHMLVDSEVGRLQSESEAGRLA